jgi:aspartyl-tRNA(Asn)/glutamyl-tRNA(Gln) amidotransferase subunit C
MRDRRDFRQARGQKTTMSIDAATVRRIAHLARVAVADDEVEHLRGEINSILSFVEQLSEVNVEGVEPMTSVTPMVMKKRADVVTDGNNADAVLRNAPAAENNYFLVPKVVE